MTELIYDGPEAAPFTIYGPVTRRPYVVKNGTQVTVAAADAARLRRENKPYRKDERLWLDVPAAADKPDAASTEAEEEGDEATAPNVATDAPATVDATASALRLAAEAGIDLATVVGSGTGGRIIKADVEALL